MPQNDGRSQYRRQQLLNAPSPVSGSLSQYGGGVLRLALAPGIEDTVRVGPASKPRDDD
jgi:hypothetical protein